MATRTLPAPPTAPAVSPAARKPPTPKRLQKKVLTLAEAADQFEQKDVALAKLAKRAKKLEAERDEAEEILLAHFEKTGNPAYQNRIGWMWSTTRTIWDGDKLKRFLGEAMPRFQKQSESKRKLTRLTPPK